jgi:hypothetical protein
MSRRFDVRGSALRVSCYCASLVIGLADAGPVLAQRALPQTERPSEKLHGILSRQRLTPPLRSATANLSYSHDGHYLLLQDRAGIYVLSRNPLKLLGYVDAPSSYRARFSADSQSLIMVSLALTYERQSIQDGQILDSKALPVPDGCVDAQISPDGGLLACYRPDFSLGVLQLSAEEWIFSEKMYVPDPHLGIIPIPLDLDVPFGGAFGFALSHDMNLLANRAVCELPMTFSPDSRTLIAGDIRGAVRVDTLGRKKTNLPSAIQKWMSGTVAMLDDTRALVIPRGKPDEPAIRSLRDGSILATPKFKADSALLATDARYALLHNSGTPGVQVFDLEDNVPLETPENIAVDIFDGEMALATVDGELFLFRKGEHAPFASLSLPAEGLAPLGSAAATPGLEKMAIAGDGEAGLFEIATGRRISSLPQFSAVNFTDLSSAFLLAAEPRSEPAWEFEYVIDRVDAQGTVHASPLDKEATRAIVPQTIWHLDAVDAKASPTWMGNKTLLRAGGPVLFEYSFESLAGRGFFLPRADGVFSRQGARLPQGIGVPFRLRALDPASGRELWSRTFDGLPPTPFADPQGERLVLSWQAKSAGAWAAAQHDRAAREMLKRAKLTDQDSFLEALDARTGKSLGFVLVQSGSNPANFDWLFSVGQAIIFSRDGVRVHVYSMQDGQLKAKLVGIHPSANAQANLFTLDEGSGRLTIYDLNTADKLDEEIFPDSIVYTHFSSDGQRLFVLTENQYAFVLDVRGVRVAH